MAPASPGGGWDATARAIQAAVARSSGQTVQVYNVPGAGGTVGLAQFAHRHDGDPHQWMVGGLVMLGAIQTHRAPVTLEDVTPIATLTTEWEAVVVPVESRYLSLRQLLADFKARPTAIRWGGGSMGGTDQILVRLIAREVGVEASKINYIPFSGGGEAQIALLSSAVTAGVSGVSESRDQVAAGRLRLLAVSSAERLEEAPAPTLREAGVNVTLANWRALFAPSGLSVEQRAAVTDAVRRMRATEEWQQALQTRRWNDFFKTGDDFSAFLEEERQRVAAVALREGFHVVGPWFFPVIVLAGLIALGMACLLRATHSPTRGSAEADAEKIATHGSTACLVALSLLLYAFALGMLGYIAATGLFFPAGARLLGSRRPVRDLLLGLALGLTLYLVFTRLLDVRLPGGIVEGWLPHIGG
jgi:putative tricarboxylic transport membrane protein